MKIPVKKKNLKNFLTSGSTTLIVGSGMLLASWWSANATISNYTVPNTLPYPYMADCVNCSNTSPAKNMVTTTPTTCNHASGIVNGHFSSIPTVNSSTESIDLFTHASHASSGSGSGGGGGWC